MIRLHDVQLQLAGFALRDIELHIPPGEFFSLLGPTGSGKTLILETVAGLMRPNRGTILLDGRNVTRLPPEQRRVGIVYQDNVLFPHLSVLENIRFGLRYRGGDSVETRTHIDSLVELLGLGRILHRRTLRLSGGEQQRVSLARALAVRPKVLLLDEPLSALDPRFREDVRRSLKQLHRELGITFLLVTHDFAEVLFLAERVGVLHRGRLEHIGSTMEVFQKPSTPFVATFVGMKNIFEAVLALDSCRFGSLNCPRPVHAKGAVGEAVHVALRPEDIVIRKENAFPEDFVVFSGRLEQVENLGANWQAFVRCQETVFTATLDKRVIFSRALCEGDAVYLGFSMEDLHIMPKTEEPVVSS